jgi:hypothetical protein
MILTNFFPQVLGPGDDFVRRRSCQSSSVEDVPRGVKRHTGRVAEDAGRRGQG